MIQRPPRMLYSMTHAYLNEQITAIVIGQGCITFFSSHEQWLGWATGMTELTGVQFNPTVRCQPFFFPLVFHSWLAWMKTWPASNRQHLQILLSITSFHSFIAPYLDCADIHHLPKSCSLILGGLFDPLTSRCTRKKNKLRSQWEK